MIEVESWNENSDFLDFLTRDDRTLSSIIEDHPLEQAVLFEDGYERIGMREVQVELVEEGPPVRVRVVHRNQALNQILQARRAGRPTKPSS